MFDKFNKEKYKDENDSKLLEFIDSLSFNNFYNYCSKNKLNLPIEVVKDGNYEDYLSLNKSFSENDFKLFHEFANYFYVENMLFTDEDIQLPGLFLYKYQNNVKCKFLVGCIENYSPILMASTVIYSFGILNGIDYLNSSIKEPKESLERYEDLCKIFNDEDRYINFVRSNGLMFLYEFLKLQNYNQLKNLPQYIINIFNTLKKNENNKELINFHLNEFTKTNEIQKPEKSKYTKILKIPSVLIIDNSENNK